MQTVAAHLDLIAEQVITVSNTTSLSQQTIALELKAVWIGIKDLEQCLKKPLNRKENNMNTKTETKEMKGQTFNDAMNELRELVHKPDYLTYSSVVVGIMQAKKLLTKLANEFVQSSEPEEVVSEANMKIIKQTLKQIITELTEPKPIIDIAYELMKIDINTPSAIKLHKEQSKEETT